MGLFRGLFKTQNKPIWVQWSQLAHVRDKSLPFLLCHTASERSYAILSQKENHISQHLHDNAIASKFSRSSLKCQTRTSQGRNTQLNKSIHKAPGCSSGRIPKGTSASFYQMVQPAWEQNKTAKQHCTFISFPQLRPETKCFVTAKHINKQIQGSVIN